VHADATEALKQKGYKIEIIRADGSEQKALVNDAEVMTDEIRSGMKTMLNSIRETFVATVKNCRAGIAEDVFDGKMFDGNAAIKRKMADRVGTMADALGRAAYHAKRDENKKMSINQISNMENQKTLALLGEQTTASLEETSVQAIETALNERDAAVAELATAQTALEDANKKVTLLGEQVADHGVISGKLKAFEDTGKSAAEVQILADWHANVKGLGITPGADASNLNNAKTVSSATAKAKKAAGVE
jgi:ClpP class serine protease